MPMEAVLVMARRVRWFDPAAHHHPERQWHSKPPMAAIVVTMLAGVADVLLSTMKTPMNSAFPKLRLMVENTPMENDYTRNGSAGTVYLGQTGQEAQLVINNNGTQSNNPQIFPAVGPAAITALSANVLTDSSAAFMAGSLKGMKLIPNIKNKDNTFTIIDNSKTTITTDPVKVISPQWLLWETNTVAWGYSTVM